MFAAYTLIVSLMTLLMINRIKGRSFNQPKFCPSSTWSSNATTVLDNTTLGAMPRSIFLNKHNSIYVGGLSTNKVRMWLYGNMAPSRIMFANLNYPQGLFVTDNGDVYIDNGNINGRVEKWTLNATSGVTVMNVSEVCYCLFIDTNDTLYCSLSRYNKVVKVSLNSGGTIPLLAAGNGTNGSATNMLSNPHGIYVDLNFNLYVADCGNNRIQLFQSSQLSGTTVVGADAPAAFILNCPTGIVLDVDGYLFIVDHYNHRIIRWGPNGFRCLVGCSRIAGDSANRLSSPYSLSFDTDGNIYVSDQNNYRIQKFSLATNSCGRSYNQPKFCSVPTWNLNATTFVQNKTAPNSYNSLFVDINNTIYVTDQNNNCVRIWSQGNSTLTTRFSGYLAAPYGIFTSISGDIYVSNAISRQIDQWTINATHSTVAMYVNGSCHGVFVDFYDNIYCSLNNHHQVLKRSFDTDANISTIVVGNGLPGSASHMLNSPQGIFVDMKFNLYVADSGNDRVQLFRQGQLNGTTLIGNGTSTSITLSNPTGIVLDADDYLFISDTSNHRIIRAGPNDVRCIIGCFSGNGSAPNQLNHPWGLGFDSYGNLFVVDGYNSRIQTFSLATNSCGVSYNAPKFCSTTRWNANAVTFANRTTVGLIPYGLFVDINNTVYVADRQSDRVQIWLEGNSTPARTLSGGLNNSLGIFTSFTGDIYIDNGYTNKRIDKWTPNATNSTSAMYVNECCYGIFVDIFDNLYCSLSTLHQVVRGIFVDVIYNLYVADTFNNRIQLFRSGELNGTTIPINGSYGTFRLDSPTDVILDGDGYLFISDTRNYRILGSDVNGFRCIVGCSQINGSAFDQLSHPVSINFDSYGNLFVADAYNHRIQKFFVVTNSCAQSSQYTSQSTVSFAFNTETTNAITSSYQSGGRSPQFLVPSTCSNSTYVGYSCNISSTPCNLLKPCQNNATCINNNIQSYICICPSYFNGTQCQYDNRPCQSNTCWNNGTCNQTSNTTFICQCQLGWKGIHCETKINYCEHVECLNNGVCHSSLMNYTCECLGESYSGRHCEIASSKTAVRQTTSKSFAYIVIVAMICVGIFIVTLDVLKYFFGIDPAAKQLKKKKPEKRKPLVIQRFIYVNAPSVQPNSTIGETKF